MLYKIKIFEKKDLFYLIFKNKKVRKKNSKINFNKFDVNQNSKKRKLNRDFKADFIVLIKREKL